MKKEVFDKVKGEISYIGLIFIIVLVVFEIAFYKENFLVSLRTVLSIFWLFILPGYCIMLYWHDNLEFFERLLIGIAMAAAAVGIASYYIGLIGLNIIYHTILLPMILILLGIGVVSLKK